MDEARKQHLELVAASLTQAYYKEHTSPNRDDRELLDTYALDAPVNSAGEGEDLFTAAVIY